MSTATAYAHYANLSAAANAALLARDAIDRPTSPEWLAAHRIAKAACLALDVARRRLAKTDRRGGWSTPVDRQMMLLGYL